LAQVLAEFIRRGVAGLALRADGEGDAFVAEDGGVVDFFLEQPLLVFFDALRLRRAFGFAAARRFGRWCGSRVLLLAAAAPRRWLRAGRAWRGRGGRGAAEAAAAAGALRLVGVVHPHQHGHLFL